MKGHLYVDTHTHYSHKRFDGKREGIIENLKGNGVAAAIECAIDLESNYRMKKLCEVYPHIFYMAAGCHPNCVEEMTEETYDEIVSFLQNEEVLAVGETGLDYVRMRNFEQRMKQEECFEFSISLATCYKKPMVIHCREAYDQLIDILKKHSLSKVPGVVHSFSGNLRQASQLIEMGFYLGVGGLITKVDRDFELCRVIRKININKVLLETDCPFLLPKGLSGINDSRNLPYIVDKLAEIRGEDPMELSKIVLNNTKEVFPLVFKKHKEL